MFVCFFILFLSLQKLKALDVSDREKVKELRRKFIPPPGVGVFKKSKGQLSRMEKFLEGCENDDIPGNFDAQYYFRRSASNNKYHKVREVVYLYLFIIIHFWLLLFYCSE